MGYLDAKSYWEPKSCRMWDDAHPRIKQAYWYPELLTGGGRHILRHIIKFWARPTLIGDHDGGSVEDLSGRAARVMAEGREDHLNSLMPRSHGSSLAGDWMTWSRVEADCAVAS